MTGVVLPSAPQVSVLEALSLDDLPEESRVEAAFGLLESVEKSELQLLSKACQELHMALVDIESAHPPALVPQWLCKQTAELVAHFERLDAVLFSRVLFQNIISTKSFVAKHCF